MKTKRATSVSIKQMLEIVRTSLREVAGTKALTTQKKTFGEMELTPARFPAFANALARNVALHGWTWSGKLTIGAQTSAGDLAERLLEAVRITTRRGIKSTMSIAWLNENKGKRVSKIQFAASRQGEGLAPSAGPSPPSQMPAFRQSEVMQRRPVQQCQLMQETEIADVLGDRLHDKAINIDLLPTASRKPAMKMAEGARASRVRRKTNDSVVGAGRAVNRGTGIVASSKKAEDGKLVVPTKAAAKKVPVNKGMSMETVPKKLIAKITGTVKSAAKKSSAKKVTDQVKKPRPKMVFDKAVVVAGNAASVAVATPLVTVKATPQMEFAGAKTAAGNYPVEVWLDQGRTAEGAVVKSIELQVPMYIEQCLVEIWTDCSDTLMLEGLPEDAVLTLQVSSGVSDRLAFTVRRVKPEGQMYVSVFFRYGGRPCGKITRFLEEVGGVLRWITRSSQAKSASANSADSEDAPPDVFAAEHGAEPADIRVEVVGQGVGGVYAMTVLTGLPGVRQKKWSGPWVFPTETRTYVDSLMKLFIQSKGRARLANLKGAGREFWGSVPEECRELIGKALEDGAKTMAVVSAEPFVPWELMIPDGSELPLGVLLQIGRWVVRNNTSPPQKVMIHKGYVVSPVYLLPKDQLQSAPAEVSFLTSSDIGMTQIIPATVDSLDDTLIAEPRSMLHLVCHGQNGTVQVLRLNDPDEELNNVMVRALDGFVSALKRHPLIFLNACEVGAQKTGLEGASGFAASFIAMEAGAIVAPLWAVQDEVALHVTKAFYPAALSGEALAGVFQRLRKKAYTETPPLDTYAAYCFYGDPLARRVMEG